MESFLATILSSVIVSAVVGPQPIGYRGKVEVTAISGKPTKIDHMFMLDENCSRLALTETESMQMPEHGSLSISNAKGYPAYRKGNPREKCNKLLADGMMIEYTSKPGYRGTDIFSVKAYQFWGPKVIAVYYVTVK